MQMIKSVALAFLILFCPLLFVSSAAAASADYPKTDFPKPLSEYHDDQLSGLFTKLVYRVQADPFNLIATILFLCAIVHTFLTAKFMGISHAYQREFQALEVRESESGKDATIAGRRDILLFRAQLFHFMGEVEAVFGIWLIPLGIAIVLMKGWPTLVSYITSLSPAEPVFVVVIMAMASSRPVLRFAEILVARVAALGRSTTAAWWLSILTIGPLLGSFITEPAVMTICALLAGFSPSLQRAVVAGAVSGGGLTVIANAPNPAGQSILTPVFGKDGIAPGGLLAAALLPTIIMAAMFMLVP